MVSAQAGWAASAASTALFTSSTVPTGTRPWTSSVPGLTDSIHWPRAAGHELPADVHQSIAKLAGHAQETPINSGAIVGDGAATGTAGGCGIAAATTYRRRP